MKLEDIKPDLTPQKVDEENWNVEEWRNNNPVDYFKYMALLRTAKNDAGMTNIFFLIKKAIDLYLPETLYKYYSLSDNNVSLNNTKFETIENAQMYLANPKNFNDPFDCKGFYYKPSELLNQKELGQCDGKIIDDFSSFTISSALTANGIYSMPMWAHYGSNHAGYCASYDLTAKENSELRMNTFPIQYIKERVDISGYMKEYIAGLLERVRKTFEVGPNAEPFIDLSIVYMTIWFTNLKHETWSYENEFRCTMAVNSPNAPYIKAKPKEIYIGMNCRSEHTQRLKEIARHLDVPVYKMVFDEQSDAYDLQPQKL